MNKASFERMLKAVAAGKSLKEIKVKRPEGEILNITHISFENDTILIHVTGGSEWAS